MALPPETPAHSTEAEDEPVNAVPLRPHLRALAVQAAAAFAVLSLAWPYFGLRGEALPWPQTALAFGAVALLIACLTRQPWWWRLIHALFAPLAGVVAGLAIDPGWFLLAAILMLLVYRGAVSGQIPLYLSTAATASTIAEITQNRPGMRFLDLGAGLGSVVVRLANARPDALVSGVENAPATWFVGYLRTRGSVNCTWRWGDIWQAKLGDHDVVYAFLSPAAMPALWAKVKREMQPGSLFISNSFAVQATEADTLVEVHDARQTRLYCYRL